MIDDKQCEEAYEMAGELIENATSGERAICLFLGIIMSELRAVRKISKDTNERIAELQKQFNDVSGGGTALLTESV